MPDTLERLPSGARVLVVRLRSLGDCVLTTPAIHLLKRHRPDLQVGVVVEDRFAAVFEGNPDVAAVLAPDKKDVLAFRPALTLNLHGGGRSATLTALSLAPRRAGFDFFRPAWMYNVRIPRAQEILGVDRTVHTAEHLASAVFFLGVPRSEVPRARLFAQPRPAAKPYAVIHALASEPSKTWPAQNFLELARRMKDFQPVFIGGPGEDLSLFHEFECLSGAPLAEVKALLAGASLFVGNDSGPAHVAAAFGVPVVVLFGTSEPVIWAPWQTPSELILGGDALAEVPVERTYASVKRLLEAVR
jgi:heptosyltransferase III